MEYNRQPYKGNPDTTGRRNRDWFEQAVWPHIERRFGEKVSLVLDVGCGNGRFIPHLKRIAERVVAIDPVEEHHPDYEGMAEFKMLHFHEFEYPEKFDAVFFLASFMIIQKQGLVDVKAKCRELLRPEGSVFIYIDVLDKELVEQVFGSPIVEETSDSGTIFIEAKC